MSPKILRIIIDALLFIGIFVFPGYIFVIVALALVFYFNSYYEILIAGFIIDSVYGVSLDMFFGLNFAFTLYSAIIFLTSLYLKKKLKFYQN
ncbi:MAG: hypothetical protein HQ402_02615 [Parcubacteria group bacterium]|nr:hypothetical protein [Parcubacteria group bacterium]